jgi:signal transduction histidine kinase
MPTLDQTAVEPSRHKCLIYDGDPSEQLPVVIPFLTESLRSNWRCLYLASPEMVQMVDSALGEHGIDSAREVKRGALILSSDRSHLANGDFQPQKMVDMLCALVDGAVDDGFIGLSATGDMAWELGASQNFDRLLEYESSLEKVFRDRPLRGICQYQRGLVPARAVRDALTTHRSAYVGDVFNQDNFFYIPPELLMDPGTGSTAAKQGEWMCQQIIRILQAEHKRDEAMKALKTSEGRQRRLASELAEANRFLEQRVAERTADLQFANEQLESFSYSVSHDLRAPLRAIIGFSNALAEECGPTLTGEGRNHLERILAGGHRMGELIEGLLTLSRMGRADLKRAPIDLSATAQEIIREMREAEPHRSAEIVIQDGMRAVGDEVLVRAALTNLLGNAWKFTSKTPKARIDIGQSKQEFGAVIFYVKDNGAGFEMSYGEKLFGVFQRLHKEEDFPGTGIGLATVQKIIKRHRGKIWAEGRPNEGATFFFTIPDEC